MLPIAFSCFCCSLIALFRVVVTWYYKLCVHCKPHLCVQNDSKQRASKLPSSVPSRSTPTTAVSLYDFKTETPKFVLCASSAKTHITAIDRRNKDEHIPRKQRGEKQACLDKCRSAWYSSLQQTIYVFMSRSVHGWMPLIRKKNAATLSFNYLG